MSSDPRSDAPSPGPEAPATVEPESELVRRRGADLLEALETRLPGARRHADSSASWALAIAVELGLDRERALSVREAARLHAIGMLYLPAELLGRPEWELSAEELGRYDEQAEAAGRLAAGAEIPAAPAAWLAHWRERFDGRGKLGLVGGAIPLESRIIRVACAFDAVLTGARHSDAEDPTSIALEWLGGVEGAELDPAATGALVEALSRSA